MCIRDMIYPRLLLHFTKNKISGFKEKLVLDLDPRRVSLKPKQAQNALLEAESFRDQKSQGLIKNDGTNLLYVRANEYSTGEIDSA